MAAKSKNQITKSKAGQPTKYRTEHNDTAHKLALLGATDEMIADVLGVSASTLYNWENKYPKLAEAIVKGRLPADAEVAGSLYRRANGYEYTEETLSKDGVIELRKHKAPDVQAASLWLRNRQPQLWRDKIDIESRNLNANIDFNSMTDDQLDALLNRLNGDK